MNNFKNKNIIEIEIPAEKIYYTIIGNKNDMNKLLLNLSNKNNIDNNKYIISKLSAPISNIISKLELDNNIININIAQNTELIQCNLLSDCNKKEEKEVYTLLCLLKEDNNYILKFPEISIKEGIEPEKNIMEDIKKIFNIVPKSIKNTLKLLNNIGLNSDILIYIARAKKK